MNSLKQRIQSFYEEERSITYLKTIFEAKDVKRYIEHQLCIDCDKLFTHYDNVSEEQVCDDHSTVVDEVEVPSRYSDSDGIRRFGEQLAALDDDEVAYYESKWESEE